jgi:hypothetical protein
MRRSGCYSRGGQRAQPVAHLKCVAYLAAIEEGPKQEREAFMRWLDENSTLVDNASRTTELDRWRGVATSKTKASWRDRAAMASLFVRSTDIVCDLGAGTRCLETLLPKGAGYIAVDCVSEFPGTHLADFNTPQFTLPKKPFNLIAALGVLNYIEDLDQFFGRLAVEAEGKFIIFTYDFWKPSTRYQGAGARTNIAELELGLAFFSKYIRGLTPVAVMRRRAMFTGTVGRGDPRPAARRSATKIACQYIRPFEYLAVKLFGVDMAPRWLV